MNRKISGDSRVATYFSRRRVSKAADSREFSAVVRHRVDVNLRVSFDNRDNRLLKGEEAIFRVARIKR